MAEANGKAAQDTEAAPQLAVLAQYIKDLSFENPRAPQSLEGQQGQPGLSVNVNVNGKQVGDHLFEVNLMIEGFAGDAAKPLFKFELDYAGIFRVANFPQEHVHPVVMIECPRLLFPFARQIISSTVSNGGFPPLNLDPIDFASLYAQRMAESAAVQAKT
ncbi:protein-export chaperone SecB [Methylovirgula sp. 4M-Z18]|uniref:protein-export chaperone SecB n=1 Tax=Methylovirgula sp. 4M-Z18 TaxID=2293567 RepID=UPI000E2EA0AC|nr:protein-export chaperone SecB [Methylovirgula sp. 4M-Z18]RFB78050.1 protein-export chaperone SecB [Methylovirgula sp. 4M-Z18]